MATQVGEASVKLKFDAKGAASEAKSETSNQISQLRKAIQKESARRQKVAENETRATEKMLEASQSRVSAWSIAAGNIISNTFTKVASVVKDGISGGIERFDTLQRFPKVLQSIGFSAGDATKAISQIRDYVQGLPTALDDAANYTQRLAQKTGNLDSAVRTYKAMNNAMLSGGASIERQSQAMEQWIQAVSRGKFEGVEWKDLQETMPGVINAAAKELLGQSASAENLRDAMSSGKISMQDFLDEIDKLNTEGADGFAPLSEQARTASEGIGTSLTIIKQRIENVWANVLAVIGDDLQKLLNKIGEFVTKAGNKLVDLVNWAKENKDWLLPLASGVATFVAAFAAVGKAITIVKGLTTAFAALTSPIGLITVGVAAAAALIVMNWDKIEPILRSVWEWIEVNILPAIQSAIAWVSANVAPVVSAIFSHIQPIMQNIISLVQAVWKTIMTVVDNLMPIIQPVLSVIISVVKSTISNIVSTVGLLVSIIDGILSAAVWTWENIISPIISFVSSVVSKIISTMAAMKARVDSIIGSIRDFFGTAFAAIKAVVSNVISAIIGVVTGVPGRVRGSIDNIKSIFSNAFESAKQVVSNAVEQIISFVTSIPSRIGDIGGAIGSKISSGVGGAIEGVKNAIGGLLSNIPGLATGGYVHATPGGTLAVIGEGGEDEFVIPRSQMIDILTGVATAPLPELKAENMRVDTGGVTIYNTFKVNNALDADDIGRRINNSIRLATL